MSILTLQHLDQHLDFHFLFFVASVRFRKIHAHLKNLFLVDFAVVTSLPNLSTHLSYLRILHHQEVIGFLILAFLSQQLLGEFHARVSGGFLCHRQDGTIDAVRSGRSK